MPPPMISLSHFGQQVLDDQDLVADLGAAQDGDVGMLRVVGGAAQVFQLLFHQEAGDGRQEAARRPRWRHARGAPSRTHR